MKNILFLILVLLSGLVRSQDQTVRVPKYEDIVKKYQLDSLASVLRGEFSGGIPSVPDCEHKVDLRSVYDVTGDGSVTYNFYSVGVEAMIETAYFESGTKAATHKTDPIRSDRVRVNFGLKPGKYFLVIENANCKAVSERVYFTVPDDSGGSIDPDPGEGGGGTEPGPSFYNPGVFKKQVGSILYEWIPTPAVKVDITHDGKLCVDVPRVLPAFEGGAQCKLFVLGDQYDGPLPQKEVDLLLGSGLELRTGNYGFRFIYVNANSLDEIRKNLWEKLGSGDGGGRRNSGGMESLNISITDGDPVGFGVKVPSELVRSSWILNYQLLSYDLNIPKTKAFGVTRYMQEVAPDKLFGKKFTHMQYRHSWLDPYPRSVLWNNIQAYDNRGQLAQPDWVIANTPLDVNYITIAELTENYGNHENDCPRCNDKAEEVFKGMYGRFVSEMGVTSPNQIRLYDDYFSPLYGYSMGVPFNEITVAQKKQGLVNQANARLTFTNGAYRPSNYFTKGAYHYRNYRTSGYIGNLFNTLVHKGVYQKIYELERLNMAIPDRKISKNGWQTSEALGLDVLADRGVFYRLQVDGGEIQRVEPFVWFPSTMITETFYHLLLGDDVVLWNSSIILSSDINHFQQSWYGGFDEWKTKWKPDGQPAVTYNPNDPSHPKNSKGKDGAIFPEQPQYGENGAFIGVWLYSQISGVSDRVSKSVRYCDFSVNGTMFRPSKGTRQDGSVSSRVTQNPGQDWVVTASEASTPICLCTEGKDGKAIIYHNPHAGYTGDQLVAVEGVNMFITGNRINVIKL